MTKSRAACDALSADGGDITFVGRANGARAARWALGEMDARRQSGAVREPNALVSLLAHLALAQGRRRRQPARTRGLQPVVLRVVNTGLYVPHRRAARAARRRGDGGEPLLASMARRGLGVRPRATAASPARPRVQHADERGARALLLGGALAAAAARYTPLSLARTPRLSTNVLGCRVLAPAVEAEGGGGGSARRASRCCAA